MCVVQALENEGQALLGNLTAVSNILSTFRSDLVSCLHISITLRETHFLLEYTAGKDWYFELHCSATRSKSTLYTGSHNLSL